MKKKGSILLYHRITEGFPSSMFDSIEHASGYSKRAFVLTTPKRNDVVLIDPTPSMDLSFPELSLLNAQGLGPKPENVRVLHLMKNNPRSLLSAANRPVISWLKSRGFSRMSVFTGKSEAVKLLAQTLKIETTCAGPKVAYWAENKQTLRLMVEKLKNEVSIPAGKNIHSLEELAVALDFIRPQKKSPTTFVIKTAQGASGLLSTVVQKREHISDFLDKADKSFLTQTVIEEWIETDLPSPSINYSLAPSGKARLLFISDQMFESKKPIYGIEGTRIHRGNRFPSQFSTSILNKIVENTKPLLRALHQGGYWGPVGFDALITKRGKVYITEINPRVTGPHYGYGPMRLLHLSHFHMLNEKIRPEISFAQLRETLADNIYQPPKKAGVILFNFFPGKFISLVMGDEPRRLEGIIEKIKDRLAPLRAA
jgi:D-alanine-D-alanine ligase-like ATP-grasp enzyme